MKDISDQTGVVFDLRADHADAFMDNFDHMKATQGRKVDFDCCRCKKLPPINGAEAGGSSSYSRGGGGGYSGGRGGGGGGFGRGPRDDRSPRGGRGGGYGGGDRGYGGGRRNNEDRDRGYGGGNSNSGGGGGWGNDNTGGGGGGAAWSKGDERELIGSKRPSYNNFDEKPVKRQMTDFNGFGGGGSSYYNGGESTAYSRNDDQNS